MDEKDETITLTKLIEKTGVIEVDIKYIFVHHNILRDDILYCEKNFLLSILKLAG